MQSDILKQFYQESEESLRESELVIINNPTDANAYLDKGAILASIRRFEEAIVAYDQAIFYDPTKAAAYSSKGESLQLLKRYEEALANFEQAILYDPTDSNLYSSKGSVLVSLKCYKEALAAYDQAILLLRKGEFGSEVLQQNKGYVLYVLERYEESLIAYNKAIELDPLDHGPYYGKIRVLRALSRDTEVPAVFAQALRQDFHPLVKVRFLRDAGWDKRADALEQAYKHKYPEEY